MSDVENVFRQIERRLDALALAASPVLSSEGITVTDRSARGYHFKNQFLCWSLEFLRDWVLENERARVTVSLTYMEPIDIAAAPALTLGVRSERFQQGQISRVDHRREDLLSLDYVEDNGLTDVVRMAMNTGERIIAAAV